MKITAILCTYNRCESLAKTLESVACSRVPTSIEWDVLVVDNNSCDQTRTIVEGFCRKFPTRFHYNFEPRPGKSYALNAAIRAAHADVLAFLDDDVVVDPDWLHNLTDPIFNGPWSGCGGRILPQVAFTPPPWLETSGRYALAPLAMFDLGLNAGELREPPFGTNMAFRTEVFAKYGEFRTDLGPQPGSEIRSEDTEFGARLLRGGERLWYAPSALVYHAVPEGRIRQEYFLKWWFDKARGDIREHGAARGTEFYIRGVPLYLYRRLCRWIISWILTLSAGRRFSYKLKVWGALGAIEECRAQNADRPRSLGKDSQFATSVTHTPKE